MKKILGLMTFLGMAAPALATTIPHDLATSNFSQNWTDISLLSTDDSWANVPSIVGYLGDDGSGQVTAVDPQTTLSAALLGAVDIDAQQTPSFTSGGVVEMDALANPTVAFQGSGTADTPSIIIYLSSLGRENVTISYNLRDVDGTTDNAIQPVALQYRVGNSGDFTNVPAGFVADASTGPSIATLVTPVSVSLGAWSNLAEVQLRIVTTNAVGSDEWIGIDDILVTSTAIVPEPTTLALAGFGLIGLATVARRRRA